MLPGIKVQYINAINIILISRWNIMRIKKLKVTSQKRSGQLHKCEGERGESEESRLHESEVDKTDNKIPESFANIA
jgi:hypothetical protein